MTWSYSKLNSKRAGKDKRFLMIKYANFHNGKEKSEYIMETILPVAKAKN